MQMEWGKWVWFWTRGADLNMLALCSVRFSHTKTDSEILIDVLAPLHVFHIIDLNTELNAAT